MTVSKSMVGKNRNPTSRPAKNDNPHPFLDITNNPILNLIFSSINDAILIADHDGTVLFVNDAYSRVTGVERNDIIGQKVDKVRKGAKLPEAMKKGIPLRGIRRKVDNNEYIADVHPIIVGSEIVGGISVLRDITEIVNLSKKIMMYSSKVKEFHRALYSPNDIVGTSVAIEKIKTTILRISANDSSVLITGESGTGKELFAHAIHITSTRSEEPFVAVNCAAFPSNLLLSELFGYEEGSFTGAQKGGKIGLFEIADNGTLFLDEIGDMELELQSKVLRVLQSGEFLKIGGTKPIKVNVRIVSATNKNLEQLIQEKKFREDLFYRLNVVPLEIPPLRSRPEDIPALIDYTLQRLNRKFRTHFTVSPEALEVLSNYNFPGNVRELFNIIEFSANTCDENTIRPEHLPVIKNLIMKPSALHAVVKTSEKEVIANALNRHENTVRGKRMAARELGISLATLYNKINQYDIARS